MKGEGQQQQQFIPALGEGFVPIAEIWEGGPSGPPFFPSELSARFFLKKHRLDLIELEAIAYYLGRLYVHDGRLRDLLKRVSLEAAKSRGGQQP